MLILGIETSCDETSASIVESGRRIISNIVYSQEKIHKKFFGVVPELASRAHLENINWVIQASMRPLLKVRRGRLNAVAFTCGPGLMGSLLVGKTVAETLSYIFKVPLIPVNHLEGHIFALLLEHKTLKPPFLALIVSGGHTELVIVEEFGRYNVLGRTLDDACGEVFDKVSKLLAFSTPAKFSYPGGPIIEKLAKKGNPSAIKFPRPYLWDSWNFSFSGLKTAVVYYVRDHSSDVLRHSALVYDICASFQSAVVDTLVSKTLKAAEKFNLKKIVVCGGVAANLSLRNEFQKRAKPDCLDVYFPSKELCTDNAAMIASCGYYKFTQPLHTKGEIKVDPNLEIKNWGY